MRIVKHSFRLVVSLLLFALYLGTASCKSEGNSPDIPEKGSISLDKSRVELHEEDQVIITPYFSGETVSKKDFIWSTDKPDIVDLTENEDRSASIIALKEGTVLVKFEASDQSLSASCQITVIKKDEDDDTENTSVIRVLGIGNSFTDDALQSYLYNLAAADGKSIAVARLTIGSSTLQDHLQYAQNATTYSYWKIDENGNQANSGSKSIAEVVGSEEWDYICFQQQSWLAGQYDSYEPYVPGLVAYVKSKSKNPNTVYTILQTWAFAYDYAYDDYDFYDNNQLTMHAALVDAAERASSLVEPKMLIVPAGTAIQNGRTSTIGDKFCRDGYHLDVNIGRFTVACTWYELIFGNVVNTSYKPGNISENHAKIAKNAARLAVIVPDKVTEMVDSQ